MISGVPRKTIDPSPERQKIEDFIFFSEDDAKGIQTPHNDIIVISMIIVKYDKKNSD